MRLVSFKRDLKGEGMTEAQIHAIIPDASKPRAATATTTTTTEPTRDV